VTLPLAGLYGSWHSWTLAGGFGHPGFVEVVPVYGLVLAQSVAACRRRTRIVMLVASTVSVVMTLGLMAAYWAVNIIWTGVTGSVWFTYTLGGHSLPVRLWQWLWR
jgi:hypothetical protein